MRRLAGRTHPRTVVVLGAGLAGAFAAAAASGPGRSVTILERDELPDVAAARKGVPQGEHAHVFLLRGLLAVERLLPGFRAELQAAGAVSFDTGDLAWLAETGWSPTGRQFALLSATRPLFEQVVLRRVRSLSGVRVRDGVGVRGLTPVGATGRAAGDGPRWQVELDDGSVEPADLVIDATGRSSRLPAWLRALGVGPAESTVVDARIGYATRDFTVDAALVRPAGIVLVQTPHTLTGGLALPVEGGRWLVGLVGSADRRPSRDPAEFDAGLAGLHDDALAEFARLGRAEGDIRIHRQTSNRWVHYERLPDWPTGLLVVGDALCAFNPIYGQGVSVAACEALVLRRALARGLGRGDERRVLKRFSRTFAVPWAIATSEDLRYPATSIRARPSQQLFGRWTREVGRLSTHGNKRAYDTIARVYHLRSSASQPRSRRCPPRFPRRDRRPLSSESKVMPR